MYLDLGTVILLAAMIAAVAGFVGFERGKKAEREHQEMWARNRVEFARMVDALPDSEKTILASEIEAMRETKP